MLFIMFCYVFVDYVIKYLWYIKVVWDFFVKWKRYGVRVFYFYRCFVIIMYYINFLNWIFWFCMLVRIDMVNWFKNVGVWGFVWSDWII